MRDFIDIVLAALTEGHLEAVQVATRSPITRKPVFRIVGPRGEDLGTIHTVDTPKEALALYRSREEKRAAGPTSPPPAPEAPEAPRARRSPFTRVPLSGFSSIDDDDGCLYHVTTSARAKAIAADGFRADAARMMTNYAAHSTGRIFFTERAGVGYWAERVEAHYFHATGREIKPVVLRVSKAMVQDRLVVDPVGTADAKATAYYVEGDVTA